MRILWTRTYVKGGPMELKFEGIEMQKWNIPTDRAQRVDEKYGVICLIIMFTLDINVMNMSKVAHFLHFLLMTVKRQSLFGQNI